MGGEVEVYEADVVEVCARFYDEDVVYELLHDDVVMASEDEVDSFYFVGELSVSCVAHVSQCYY